jgi:hypothetical protein
MMICKLIKMSNGDTIIGNVAQESRGYVEVDFPMKVIITFRSADNDDTSYRLTLTKWDPMMNYSLPLRIFKHGISAVAEPTPVVVSSYQELYQEHLASLSNEEEDEDEYETSRESTEEKVINKVFH